MSGISVVAKKEFLDHVTGIKFLAILTLFLLISVAAIYGGVDNYNDQLEWYKEQMSSIEESPENFPPGYMPPGKPSILLVFQIMSGLFIILGVILALALGFDLISGEKDGGSLKSLLSHPVYRDAVINGKAIGGICALGLTMLIVMALSIGSLMLLDIVPTGEELLRILIFMGLTLLFMFSFFSVALMLSAVSKSSIRSILYSLLIFFMISYIIPLAGVFVAMEIVGDMPEYPGSQVTRTLSESGGVIEESVEVTVESIIDEEEMEKWEKESEEYGEKVMRIQGAFSIADPTSNFKKASSSILNPGYQSSFGFGFGGGMAYGESSEEKTITESLGIVWSSLVVLIVFPIVMFVISYIRFMRMDLR